MSAENEPEYRSVYRRGEAMGYREGVNDERDRIIKLAKELEHKSMTHSELCTREHYFVEKLIAAIKKENK
jgi:hypothetical protein